MSSKGSSRSLLASMALRRLEQLRTAKALKRAKQEAETRKNLQPLPPEHDRFAAYRSDPVRFAIEVLGVFLYPRQEEILRAIANTKKGRVAVRSGHKCGKSIVAVIAALWTVCCFPRSRVVLTATSGHQVRNVLWKELRTRYREAKVPLGGVMAKTPAGGFKFEDGREIIGLSVDKTENIAGYSGANVLWIVDEASGVNESIFEAIEGNAQSGARIVIISNPTKTVGFFYDAFHTRAAEWDRFKISAEEAAPYADRIPGLSRPEEIEKKIKRLGREHPIVRVRVLGEFPGTSENTIVSLHLVEQAHERWIETVTRSLAANGGNFAPQGADAPAQRRYPLSLLATCTGTDLGALEIGVDAARFGDDNSTITPRRGKFVYPQVIRHGLDGVELAGAAIATAKLLRKPHEKVTFKVDGIGIGASCVDQLRKVIREEPELRGWEIHDINVSKVSDDEEKFPNLRSQLWFAVSEFLEEGGTLPPPVDELDEDGALDAELMAPIYKFDPKGRQVVESKADTKKRINRSPDRADSLSLAIYGGAAAARIYVPKRAANGGGYRFAGGGRGY